MDFDGKVFGETSSKHAIKKFYKVKAITTLELFPLKYYPGKEHIRT